MRKLLLIIFLGLYFSNADGQVPVVWEPDLSMSGGLKGQWNWNTKLVMRLSLGQLGKEPETGAGQWMLAEAQAFVSRRLVGGRRITLGLLYGLENPLEDERPTEKRIIWQYSFRTPAGNISLSHRARIEQRFFDESFQHRIRYRITAERPLTGDKLDAGEWYVLVGSEILLSSDEAFENLRFDNRSGVGAGMLFANEHRLQFELQHRAQRIFDERYNSRIWLLTSWIVPL